MNERAIVAECVSVHNLKRVSCTLPHGKLYCLTGVSGSGKSSFAFDTLYVEGQRRYVESLSHHAKRLIGNLPKPDALNISGLTPTIAIEQKTAAKNPRSTVGTLTEVYDYLRILFSKVATPYCPESQEPLSTLTREEILQNIYAQYENKRILVLSPLIHGKKGDLQSELENLEQKGFIRVRLDGKIELIESLKEIDPLTTHDLDAVVDRMEVNQGSKGRLLESISTAIELGQGMVIICTSDTEEETLYSQHAYSRKSGKAYPALESSDFAFNSPQGMCPECHGLGTKYEFILEKIIDPEKSVKDDFSSIASSYQTIRYRNIYDNLAHLYNFSVDTPWKKLSPEAKKVLLYGTKSKWTRMVFIHPETGATWHDTVQWRGILHEAFQRYNQATSETYRRNLEELMRYGICQSCKGSRLKPYPSAAQLFSKTILDVVQMTIDEAYQFFSSISLSGSQIILGHDALVAVIQRLSFLKEVGLGYLSLDRTSPTLSGGESQRVRLASQIGSGLVGVTYILDEPSIGLHSQDNHKLIASLETLRDRGNTVIVVEHDEETIHASDCVIDFGPKAGQLGGQILFQGDPDQLLSCPHSLTGQYLSGKKTIFEKKVPRSAPTSFLTIENATHNNLKNVRLDLPLERFVAITGVSGSGKSSLFLETLYPTLSNTLMGSSLTSGPLGRVEGIEKIDKVIEIDQTPIGRTPRSNPATYTKVFDDIRTLFSQLPESKMRGFLPGRFSFNVKNGSCATCGGMGSIKIDLDLVEESWVLCPECEGKRFDEETLSITYKGKTIQDVLEMTVAEAHDFFSAIPSITKKLKTLSRVGLDYITLGQSATTLSGGEAQRLKLSKELSRPSTGKTLYILDEPTTGLHFYDLSHLLEVLHELVDRGNSVVVIEHNLDLIVTADWIIDMGPGSGNDGGLITDVGPVSEICKRKTPTGIALKNKLSPRKKKGYTKTTSSPLQSIVVKGARQNNLSAVDVTIPRGSLTTVVGPSGSGKSSLVFDTIFAEGQRRYVESLSPYIRQFVKQPPKPRYDIIEGLSPAIAVEARQGSSNPRSTVGTITECYDYLRVLWAQVGTPFLETSIYTKEKLASYLETIPDGKKMTIYAPILFENPQALIQEGFIKLSIQNKEIDLSEEIPSSVKKGKALLQIDRFKTGKLDRKRLLSALSMAQKQGKNQVVVRLETQDTLYTINDSLEITPKSFAFNTKAGQCPDCEGLGVQYGLNIVASGLSKNASYRQILNTFSPEYDSLLDEVLEANSISLKSAATNPIFFTGSEISLEQDKGKSRLSYRGINEALELFLKEMRFSEELPQEWVNSIQEQQCPTCHGDRINQLAASVQIDTVSLPKFCCMPINEAITWLENHSSVLQSDKSISRALEEATKRLEFLNEIGLGYLSLHRSAATLSGGEAQRVRLASQLGLGLGGILYVLDEPTLGLHPVDTERLVQALIKLKNLNNTILVVEHDPQVIEIADHVLELGPNSGKEGGKILFEGTPQALKQSKSTTGAYLFEKLEIPPSKRKFGKLLNLNNVSCHNIENISCSVPLNALTSIIGVSGSGKSTFAFDILYNQLTSTTPLKGAEAFKRIVAIDQKPVGMTSRSDVSTFLDLMAPLRQFFAMLPEAMKRGLKPVHFSPSSLRGMCMTCWGLGVKRVEMSFMAPLTMECPACLGKRLNPSALSVYYRGKNLGELLKLGAKELLPHFEAVPGIKHILDVLIQTDLGYLPVGQMIQTISGGELQRLKVARELTKKRRGTTFYIFDEPTAGLHPREVDSLLVILKNLVSEGHTVLVVEHNLKLIASSDYLIEFGPGAGSKGGKIISTGTPFEVMKLKDSPTGKMLKKYS